MDLVDSFRDTDGARRLIKQNIEIYRQTYNDLGLIFLALPRRRAFKGISRFGIYPWERALST